MRKKLFAILMSAMMMVTFMPAMAFATAYPSDSHSYAVTVTEDGYVSWEAVQQVFAQAKADPTDVTKAAKAASIKVIAEPTKTTEGKVELSCTAALVDAALKCDNVFTARVAMQNTHTCSDATKTITAMSKEAYHKGLLVAGDYDNETQMKYELANDTYCSYVAEVCTCGKVEAVSTAYSGVADTVGYVEHKDPSNRANICADKVECAVCHELFRSDTPHAAALHSFQKTDGTNDTTKVTSQYKICDSTGGKTTVVNVYECTNPNCKHVSTDKPEPSAIKCVNFKNEVTGNCTPVYNDGSFLKWGIGEAYTLGDGKLILKPGYIVVTVDSGVKTDEVVNIPGSERLRFFKNDGTVTNADGSVDYVFVCEDCGYRLTVQKSAATGTTHTEHTTFEKVVTPATCTSPAMEQEFCTVCGQAKTGTSATPVKDSKALGHKYEVTKIDATCVNPAYYVISCSVCGKHEVAEVGSEYKTAGYMDWTGFTGQGEIALSGQDCIRLNYEAKLAGHKYTKQIVLVEATCTNPQIVGYACDTCGKIHLHTSNSDAYAAYAPKAVAGTQLKHVEEKVHKAATCGKYGKEATKCSVCGSYKIGTVWYTEKELDANRALNVWTEIKTEKPLVKEGAKCVYDAWTVTTKATIFAQGAQTESCSLCGSIGTEKVAIAKLSYAAPKVSVKKGKVVVTVAAQTDAVKYVVKAGKKTKTVTAAGKVTLKKVAKKGKKVKVTVTAYNAAGAKVVSKAKTVKVR